MIAGAAGLLSLAGTGLQVYGALQQAAASKKAEQLRANQMNLEAQRARREQIRRAQVARAQATASAVTQGAQFSSALAGGQSQINNEAGRNRMAINQDQQIGNAIFSANRDYANAGMISTLGGGVSSLGGAFASNAETITRLSY